MDAFVLLFKIRVNLFDSGVPFELLGASEILSWQSWVLEVILDFDGNSDVCMDLLRHISWVGDNRVAVVVLD